MVIAHPIPLKRSILMEARSGVSDKFEHIMQEMNNHLKLLANVMESERKMKSLPKQACREEIYVGMHNQRCFDHGTSQMLNPSF